MYFYLKMNPNNDKLIKNEVNTTLDFFQKVWVRIIKFMATYGSFNLSAHLKT